MRNFYAGVILIVGAVTIGAQTNQYVITDLGSLGGVSPYGGSPTSAQSINNAGQVVGSSYVASGVQQGFRTGPNSPINPATDAIGTLGGSGSSASSVNNSGQVAGSSQLSNGDTHAIRVDADGSIHDLGVLGGTVDFSLANGINDAGQVTGASWHTAPGACFGIGGSVAFLTAANSAITASDDLGTLLSNCRGSDGYAVNSSGVVVGYSAFGNLFNPVQHAMVWTPGSGMVDLGVLGGVSTFPAVQGTNAVAYAINASGQIVGNSTYNHDSSVSIYSEHAFLTTANGPMVDLGTLGGTYSTAFGINTAGQIVGSSTTTADAALHGYLYMGNTMLDLNTMIGSAPKWVVQNASAINDNGQIVAAALFSDGSAHAVRMDPANLAVGILTNLVANPSLALTGGQINSLTGKLNYVLASIQAGLNGQAINQLNAFLNEVSVQTKNGHMSAASANALTAAANSIIAAIS